MKQLRPIEAAKASSRCINLTENHMIYGVNPIMEIRISR